MNAGLTPSSAAISDLVAGERELQPFAVELEQPPAPVGVRERKLDRLVDPPGPGGERGLEQIRAVRGQHEQDVVVLVEAVHPVEQLEQDRVRRLERAIHGDEVDVLEHDHRRLQRGGQVDRRADGAEALPGQQHRRAAGHLRREVHRGQRLARARRPVEQQAAAQVPPARAQPLGVLGDAERLALDPLQHARREHDPVARDPRQRAHGQRRALVVVEVPRAQLEHAAAVDVALAHQRRRARRGRARPRSRSAAMTSSPRRLAHAAGPGS